jgi:hypothetical protein
VIGVLYNGLNAFMMGMGVCSRPIKKIVVLMVTSIETGLAGGWNGCSESNISSVSGKGTSAPSVGLAVPVVSAFPVWVSPHLPSRSVSGYVVKGVPVAWLKCCWFLLRIRSTIVSVGSVIIFVSPFSSCTSNFVILPRMVGFKYFLNI